MSKRIVRIWLYKVSESFRYEDCKPSSTNKIIPTSVRGDFKYYAMDGNNVTDSTRKEADLWSQETGEEIETMRGYPAFMHDMGYRA